MLRTPRQRIATAVARSRLPWSPPSIRHSSGQVQRNAPSTPSPDISPPEYLKTWDRLAVQKDNGRRDPSAVVKAERHPSDEDNNVPKGRLGKKDQWSNFRRRRIALKKLSQWPESDVRKPKSEGIRTGTQEESLDKSSMRPLIQKYPDPDSILPLVSRRMARKNLSPRTLKARLISGALLGRCRRRRETDLSRSLETSAGTDAITWRNIGARLGSRSKFDSEACKKTADDFNEHLYQEGEHEQQEGILIRVGPEHPHQDVVCKFNDLLKQACRSLYDNNLRLRLFAAYREVKRCDPLLLYNIPCATWQRLWKMQSTFRPLDTTRLDLLERLVRDMELAGLDVSTEKQIVVLERMSDRGHAKQAAAEWETRFILHAGQTRQKDWLEAGTRLHAAAGDIDRVCQILDLTIKSHKSADPRFILFLIWRHIESGDPSRARKGWLLYERLKAHSSFQLSTDDYSSIFKSFLNANDRRAALQILKDMAKSKRLPDPHYQLPTLCFGVRDLQDSCSRLKFLHYVSLEALKFLPKDTDLDHFFSNWLSRAATFRQSPIDITDECAQIIELMFESGLAPSAAHFDKLIRVWFLMDKPEEAESIAWNMINKRMVIVEKDNKAAARLAFPDYHPPQAHPEQRQDLKLPEFMKRPIPPAAARTFTHLAKHYAESNQPDYAQYVLNLLLSTSLNLNSKSLRAVIVIHLALNDPLAAWNFFDKIRHSDAAAVNLYTYNMLWKGAIANIRQIRRRSTPTEESHHRLQRVEREVHEKEYPDPRHLFADMLHFIRTKYPALVAERKERNDTLPPNLLDRVVGTFMLCGDPLGALVAMKTLHLELGLAPTKTTIETLVFYTSREAMKAEQKLGATDPPKFYENMAYGVLEYLWVNSHELHNGRKIRTADLHDKVIIREKGADVLIVLGRYLRVLMERYWGSKDVVDGYLVRCEIMMGARKSDAEIVKEKVDKRLVDMEMEERDALTTRVIEDWFS
jgi:hypothetical protein